MPNWGRLRAGIERQEQRRQVRRSNLGQWDWYAEGCPCGLPAGECREHPRARANQRPPAGDWRTWLLLMGRGAGKTRSAAEWVRHRVESGAVRAAGPGGATAADVRDTMVDGQSGILAVSPPWFRPRYEPSKRRLTWPNGARATTFSAEEPDRLRGPQHDCAWLDELAAFRYPAAMDNLLLGLRLGADPRLCVTTTPRPVRLVTDLIGDPTTAIARGTTYDNRANLAPSFFERIVTKYEGTRLGQQELLAEVLEVGDGVWFPGFDPAKHVTRGGRVRPAVPGAPGDRLRRLAARGGGLVPGEGPRPLAAAADGLRRLPRGGPVLGGGGQGDPGPGPRATLSGRMGHGPAGPGLDARTGIGPTAYGEFERVFGPRSTGRWPRHRVTDGLDQLELLLDRGLLLIHPRCTLLKSAFLNYARTRTGHGDWLDEPADPQHPHEDLMDALRGGVRDRFPEGRIEQPAMRTVHASLFV